MQSFENESVTSLYVNTKRGDILFLCVGAIGRRIANLIKKSQDNKDRTTAIRKNEKLNTYSIDTRNYNIKVVMLLTNSAEPATHLKFRELANQCRDLNIVSILFFAFEAEHYSQYPQNHDEDRYVDGVQLETVIQLSSKHFNFTHCDYVYRNLSRTGICLTPTKALVRDGNSIVESLLDEDKVYYFMKDNAINMHDYWWDVDF